MNPLTLIDKFYPEDNELKHILLVHSRSVTDKALALAKKHPGLDLDLDFIEEAAMLHDIGIFLTDAPDIQCFGTHPYICHGYLGADLVRKEGFPRHALVCERHTGAGLSLHDIEEQGLPIPHREMVPVRKKRASRRHGRAWQSTEAMAYSASTAGASFFYSRKNTLKTEASAFIYGRMLTFAAHCVKKE